MKKNDFIYSGSALYRISKIENNLVKVVPTSRKMTCSLASRTYHQSQLEDLGYKIRGDLLPKNSRRSRLREQLQLKASRL